MPGTIKNLAQHRAQFAYAKVKDLLTEDEKTRKEFKSYVKNVPMMIKTNGFTATYAFVFSKNKKSTAYEKIEEISQAWLVDEQNIFNLDSQDFYEKIAQLPPDQYRRAIKEILALFTWLKRFADGLID